MKKSDPADNDNVLFIGKLTETKGCYSLIKAFNLCAEQNPNLNLRLAGKGDEDILKSMIDPRFIERVHFLGYCDRERLKEEIDNCSFACIPSYFESFGMVAIEVMARNRTIIYTDRTAASELIHDSIEGYLVNPDNIGEIADKVNALVSSHGLRDDMADNAYKRVLNKFCASAIVSELVSLYSSL